MKKAKKTTKKIRKLSVWQRIVKQEIKQGDGMKKALKDAKKRYAQYKKTGKIPPVI